MRKDKRYACLSVVLIIVLNLLVYANTFKVPFQFDDVVFIKENKDILEPLDINSFIKTYFLRSIVRWSFAVNHLIGEFNTIGYHIVNLSLHIIISIFFFLILRNLYTNRKWNLPLLATLLFSLHPVQIESVTYLMSRSELLATLFYLLAFYFFINSTQNFPAHTVKTIIFSVAALICFFLGLGSKLTIVSLPIILIIYLYTLNINSGSVLSVTRKYKWLLMGVLTTFTLFLLYRLLSPHGLLGISSAAIERFGRWGYFMTQVKAFYFYYLKLLFFPINLNISPDFSFSPSLWQTICFLIPALLVLIYSTKKYLKKFPLLIFSVFWILITLMPTSSIVPLNDLVAEHRLYLPSLGFFIVISLVIVEPKQLSEALKAVVLITLVIVFSTLTVQRNKVWIDATSLWEDAMEKSPFSVRPYINAGRSYYYKKNFKKAATAYEKANEIDSFYFESHYNLGAIYYKWGNLDKAAKEFLIALQLNKNLSGSYINLGKIYTDQKKYELAIKMYKAAIDLQTNCSVCFLNLAILYYYDLKDYEKAKFYFQQVLKLDPEQNQKQKIQSIIDSLDTT